MRIALASDHAGFKLKEEIALFLREEGHEVLDFGCHDETSVDYPDYGMEVARRVSSQEVERGILICGTGIGMSIVANKFPGVRAALVSHIYTARMAREHNDANILVLAGRVLGGGLAREMVREWLKATFQGGRHARRLKKIEEIEKRNFKGWTGSSPL
ncbi:MAG: ribose 5-phosphate isomerase B [Deltaproteobacteria bacterium]|nr:MAG: ribose 5-phosphate isomerase B [Deltaproteobacteria bacterium]RLA96819.1 MAG: ribose 5-phosphate isomerase B [Deltaproteobacteria bacterium]